MSNYQIAFDHALKDLRTSDPAVVVRNALAEYQAENRQYIVPFFKRPHIVSLETGQIYEQDSGRQSSIGVGTTIMHYLSFAKDVFPSGRWVSLKELHDCKIFFPAFQKAVIQPLTETFENNLEGFIQCAAMLGGEKIKMGHAAVRFEAFPKLPLAIVLWAGDEEVPGAANFLYDSTVEYFSPAETIIGYGYFLTHILLKYARLAGHAANVKTDPMWD